MRNLDREIEANPDLDRKVAMRSGMRVTWWGLAVNVGLAVIKFVAGTWGNSQALVADAVHSLSDLFSDIVVLLGLRWGRKGEDADHHYGHGRIETLSALIVGVILIAVGIGIIYSAVVTIRQQDFSTPGPLVLAAAFLSIVAKEAIYRYTISVGRRIRSLAIVANAWHHRTDALSSIAVLIGVTAAYLNPDWQIADPIAAIVVSGFIIKVGASLTWGSLREVVDTAPDQEVLREIVTKAVDIEGVDNVHDLRARYSGSEIFVELHIIVDPNLTVREGHDIATAVEHRLLDEMPDVTRAIVHVDPEPD